MAGEDRGPNAEAITRLLVDDLLGGLGPDGHPLLQQRAGLKCRF